MGIIRRTAWAALIWLTAASTVLAGFPHFDCRCPNGQVKPFCFGFCSKTAGCCCGGTGCSAKAGCPCCRRAGDAPSSGQSRKAACCHQQASGPGKFSAQGGLDVAGGRCTKTLVQPELLSDGRDTHASVRAASLSDALPGQPFLAGLRADSVRGLDRGLTHSLAPLSDLVIALRRLLI